MSSPITKSTSSSATKVVESKNLLSGDMMHFGDVDPRVEEDDHHHPHGKEYYDEGYQQRSTYGGDGGADGSDRRMAGDDNDDDEEKKKKVNGIHNETTDHQGKKKMAKKKRLDDMPSEIIASKKEVGFHHDHGDDSSTHRIYNMDKSPHKSIIVRKKSSTLSERVENAVERMALYSNPKQRQRWGDTQIQPMKNWGDIFFDLFYVASAYNLGNLLKHDPTGRGLLYLIGLFWPIIGLWLQKLIYDARFYVGDDLFHRFYEVAVFLAIASAISHIQPLTSMEHVQESSAMLAYAISIAVGCFLAVGRFVEVCVAQKIVGSEGGLHPEAYHASWHQVLLSSVSLSFFIAAAAYAGIQYYVYGVGNDGWHTTGYDSVVYDISNDTTTNETDTTSHQDDIATNTSLVDAAHERWLSTANAISVSYTTEPNDITIYLLLAGAAAHILAMAFNIIVWFHPRITKDPRSVTVPMNIDYCIHRYGEWTMLLLGESVLSLLIVQYIPNKSYITTFYCGLISIALLAYLHFRSQPHHADEHAMRRDRVAGFFFAELFQVYSVALIVLGASFKMFLSEQVSQEQAAAAASLSVATANNTAEATIGRRQRRATKSILSRFLATSAEPSTTTIPEQDPNRTKHIAIFYCGALVMVWLCMDVMLLLHRGIRKHQDQLEKCTHTRCFFVYALLLVRVGLIVFMATFWLTTTEPDTLAIVGLVCIILQLFTREGLERLFPSHGQSSHHTNEEDVVEKEEEQIDEEEDEDDPDNASLPSHAEGEAIG